MIMSNMRWVQLPAANGYEQRGRRPAVFLQDDHYAGGLPVVLVVPLTTTRAALRFAGTTLIQPTARIGFRQMPWYWCFRYGPLIAAAYRSASAV